MPFNNIVYVYDKTMKLLATFDEQTAGLSPDSMLNLMASPIVHLETNGTSTFSFQMIANCEKFQQIKDPENIFYVNGRYYTALNNSAYDYVDDKGVLVVNATLTETWSLLSRSYNQAYNCGIYCYAKAKFIRYTNDGAEFTITSTDCLNPGNTITNANAWEQVKNWEIEDEDGNQITYAILSADEFKATNWEDIPSGVFMKSFSVYGNTATIVIESRAKIKTSQIYPYNESNSYKLDVSPLPSTIEGVKINFTVTNNGSYSTNEKDVTYSYNPSTGIVSVNYFPTASEQINAVSISYLQNDLGTISPGATCTFAYGAEAIDEHTFVILPKAKTKYKLTIDNVTYDESQVKDSRGVIMPRGSGGYAMWAALKNSGWTLGICDVLATDFDPTIDYGCFNVESDMKDVLYNIQYIQQLYGGILDWDSEHKVLNYRAENGTDYQAYDDGFNKWTGYEFREGKNMTKLPQVTYDNNIITRAYVLGYGNLNIKAVNDGKSYIDDFSFSNTIYEGYLNQPLIYDTRDEGGQRQLLYWGKKELGKQCRPRKSIVLTVTDIRTVEGMEHEIFDLNDVVKVYYKDEFTGEQVVEEQRVVLWEYNVFAMWDCTVELGEKTSNLTELFKLIYNKSLKNPDVNNSGQISASNVHLNGLTFDGSGFNRVDYGNEESLPHYIELLARTTTKNSDAIAGLIIDTSSMHSQVDLFALYQKQTDNLFTQTYAGLTLYADEKKAEAILDANHYSEKLTQNLNGDIIQKISETDAQLRLYADQRGSAAELVATGYYNTLKNDISQLEINTQAGFRAEQNERNALAQQFAAYQTTVNGQISQSQSYILNYVAQNYATAQMLSQVNNNVANIQTTVDNLYANISLTVSSELSRGGIYISAGNASRVTISSEQCVINSALLSLDTITYINAPLYASQGSIFINHRGLYNGTASLMSSAGTPVTINYVEWQ